MRFMGYPSLARTESSFCLRAAEPFAEADIAKARAHECAAINAGAYAMAFGRSAFVCISMI
jgi:hypothetical protein